MGLGSWVSRTGKVDLKRETDTTNWNPDCQRGGAKGRILGMLTNQPTHSQAQVGVGRPISTGRVG